MEMCAEIMFGSNFKSQSREQRRNVAGVEFAQVEVARFRNHSVKHGHDLAHIKPGRCPCRRQRPRSGSRSPSRCRNPEVPGRRHRALKRAATIPSGLPHGVRMKGIGSKSRTSPAILMGRKRHRRTKSSEPAASVTRESPEVILADSVRRNYAQSVIATRRMDENLPRPKCPIPVANSLPSVVKVGREASRRNQGRLWGAFGVTSRLYPVHINQVPQFCQA